MGTSASFALARKITACLVAALLSLALVPASALAEDGHSGAEGSEGAYRSEVPTSPQPPSDPSTEASSSDVTLSGDAEGGEAEGSNKRPLTLASGLVGAPSNFINSDVVLDSEPVIGSFTVDGLTYAVMDESHVELVGVVPSVILSEGSEAGVANLTLPETVTYEGTTYTLTSIAPYAFYLSGVTDVELPASVPDVDDRAFRSSDVANVSVAEGNPTYSSFDGALYSADKTRLLLIPEGRVGAVLLPREAEVADPGKFSHCSLVDAISVEDGAAFASENGLLYDASLSTLLRVPAGATDITIRDGCTTIAAGAMEACVSLATITAPASVASISPYLFEREPVAIMAPLAVTSVVDEGEVADDEQLSAVVALSTIDDALPNVDPKSIVVEINMDGDVAAEGGFECATVDALQWASAGYSFVSGTSSNASYVTAASFGEGSFYITRSNSPYLPVDTLCSRVGEWGSSSINWTMTLGFTSGSEGLRGTIAVTSTMYNIAGYTVPAAGYSFAGFSETDSRTASITSNKTFSHATGQRIMYAIFAPNPYTIALDPNGDKVTGCPASISTVYDAETELPSPKRPGYAFKGWDTEEDGSGTRYLSSATKLTTASGETVTLYAQWEPYVLDFKTSEEPGDEDYPGEEKPSISAPDEVDDEGKVEIANPKRPGYVFQGWTIPNAEGTEALDQDLVYQGDDGKWYVDASKLPDYAGDDGRVELTARWTSVISVDVPSSVTFYADVVTQGSESREGLASSAFGQSKVQSQSEVDLRIVGLESRQVKGDGSTSLGASDILKRKDGSAVSGTADKLFSLYPAAGELAEDDLKDPDATSASKPAGAVDFSLDDTLLEKSFAADKFTIPAGDTLSLGYRLNLQETSTELDYDKLSTLSEGTSASIANISYCFAASGLIPTGSKSDPLWVENTHPTWGVTGVYGLKDIKAAAEDLSSNPSDLEGSPYYSLYKMFLDNGEIFHVKVDGVYLDLQLLGICQDNKTAGGKAGFTFQMKDIYSLDNTKSIAAGQGSFLSKMHSAMDTRGGWQNSLLRNELRTTFFASLAPELQQSIAPVTKFQQLPGGTTKGYLQVSYEETIWLPSLYEICGGYYATRNESESSRDVPGYEPFGYQAYAAGGAVSKQKTYNGSPYLWWTRSSYRSDTTDFNCVTASGQEYSQCIVTYPTIGVVPCFCL